MKKKILISSLLLFSLGTKVFAQETDDTPKSQKQEKVIIKKTGKGKNSEKTTVVVDNDKVIVNGEPVENESDDKKTKKQKRITVMVDGDNITINGKPIDKMSEQDLIELKGSADHLGVIAPFMRKMKGRNIPIPPIPPMLDDFEGTIDGNFDFSDEPTNKALLGVVTIKDENGAKISTVSKESAAEKAGLQKDDIITKINDYKISSSNDLVQAISKHNPEDKVTVTYIRDGKTKTTDAILGKNEVVRNRIFRFNNEDAAPMEMFPFGGKGNGDFKVFHKSIKPKLGLKIQDVEEGTGVKVLEVDENTPASKAGLQKDDIINDINGEAIKTVDDLKEKTKNLKEGETYKIKFKRNGNPQTADIKLPKKLKTADL